MMSREGFFDRFFKPIADCEFNADPSREIVRSVEVLLNTRSPYSASYCASLLRRTVVDYGLPDFVHLSPQSRTDTEALVEIIRHTIESHEPRLSVHDIFLETPRSRRDLLQVTISGRIRLAQKLEQFVCFVVGVG